MFDTAGRVPATKQTFTDSDRAFAAKVSDYWFNFAKDGAPAAKGAPAWPRDTRLVDRTMMLAEPIEVKADFMKLRLDVMIGLTRIIGAVAGPR